MKRWLASEGICELGRFNGLPRDRSRGSQRPTQREERESAKWGFGRSPTRSLDWLVVGLGTAPYASRLLQIIAGQGVGTAAGDHSGRLVGQILSWIHHFAFQRNLMPNMSAVLDLADLPSTESHFTSNVQMQFTRCQTGFPVTRVTIVRDKIPQIRTIKTLLLYSFVRLLLETVDCSPTICEIEFSSGILPESGNAGPRFVQDSGLPGGRRTWVGWTKKPPNLS